MRIRGLAVIALAVWLLAFVGCRCERAGGKAQGRLGGDATPVIRVVSLSPSTTEALFAIGAGDQLVGRSRYCDMPQDALRLPIVGGYTDPNYEVIFALAPALVVGARGPAGPKLAERLSERGIRTFFPETESVAQIEQMLFDLGKEVGREEAAKAIVEASRARIAAVERAVSGRRRPRVLMLFDVEPVVAAGPKSFPDELLRLAGATNALREGSPYPVIGLERLLVLDPDVVVDTTVAMDRKTSRINKSAAGWEKLRAVREGRVIGISEQAVLRPGPRIADAVEHLAKVLHAREPLP